MPSLGRVIVLFGYCERIAQELQSRGFSDWKIKEFKIGNGVVIFFLFTLSSCTVTPGDILVLFQIVYAFITVPMHTV